MTLAYRSRNNRIAWAVVSAAALLYFITSLAVVVGAFVWLGIFPGFWYATQKALYWPFQPYLDVTLSVFGGPDIPYPTYAIISRSPFLIVPILIWIGLLRPWSPSRSAHRDDLRTSAER